MVKNSTLFYLVDDVNQLSDILFSTSLFSSFIDEELDKMLDFLEYDPGADLVSKILQRANVE